MSFVKQYFGHSAEELTYQNIIDYFALERQESDKIEFKSYQAGGNETEKENGVIRSICAFLNSSGGIVIWGAPEGKKVEGKDEKIFSGGLSPVTRLIEKDYFVNRLTDSITPAPNSVFFHIYTEGNNFIYIIEILQSEYSPHQFRNIYYMRIDGQTKPAPHHYIEALFRKITFPKLKGYVNFSNFRLYHGHFYLDIRYYVYNISKLQHEHQLYCRIFLGPGAEFINGLQGNAAEYFMDNHDKRVTNAIETLYYNQPYTVSETIRLTPAQMKDSEIRILFYFAGKKSPLLTCSYKLRPNFNIVSQDDVDDFIIQRKENQYSYEYSDQLDLTEEDRIRQVVGRA